MALAPGLAVVLAVVLATVLVVILVPAKSSREPERETRDVPSSTAATPDVEALPFLSQIDVLELLAFGSTAPPSGRSPAEREEREEPASPAEDATRLLSGIVFEGEDGPVSAGQVAVLVDTRRGSPTTAELLDLGPDGSFEVRVPLDVNVRLRAELPHGPVGLRRVISYSAEPPLDVAIHAYPRGSLSGRLVDLRGRGLTGFRVEARQSPRARHPDELREIRPSAVTDSYGSFNVTDLRLAPVALVARSPRGSETHDWPLVEGLEPASAVSDTYTLPLVLLAVSALDETDRELHLCGTRSNWVPSDTSALTFEPLGAGWTGLPGGLRPSSSTWGRLRGMPVILAAEVGHDYRLTLTGWDHATLVHDVRVPDDHEDVELALRPAMAETRVPVELALEDPRILVGEQFRWQLMALRNEMHHPLSIPGQRNAVVHVELPPGRYRIGARFLASIRAKSDPEGHGADTSPELREDFWSVSDEIEVREPADAPGVQRFVLRSEHARPPFPPGLVGPGDY